LGANVDYSFDPNKVIAIDDQARSLGPDSVSDDWGILEATKGVLLVRENGELVRAGSKTAFALQLSR